MTVRVEQGSQQWRDDGERQNGWEGVKMTVSVEQGSLPWPDDGERQSGREGAWTQSAA